MKVISLLFGVIGFCVAVYCQADCLRHLNVSHPVLLSSVVDTAGIILGIVSVQYL